MRDDDDGQPQLLVDVVNELQDGFRRLRIERARRLIREKHLRVGSEGARDADALLLSA